MAITNGYATLAEAKTLFDLTLASHEADIERAIESASRAIDAWCGRRFWQDNTVTVYYFTAEDYYTIPVFDVSTTTGLIVQADHNADGTHENTFTRDSFTAAYSYRLLPRNAATAATARPWTHLKALTGGFPVGVDGGVKVTMKAGWAAVPIDIEQACLLLASRIYKRKDSPFGVLGVADIGGGTTGTVTLPKVDPDVQRLLGPYRRLDAPTEAGG